MGMDTGVFSGSRLCCGLGVRLAMELLLCMLFACFSDTLTAYIACFMLFRDSNTYIIYPYPSMLSVTESLYHISCVNMQGKQYHCQG
jgi:hypothetical protein